jgi:hypothetical protein
MVFTFAWAYHCDTEYCKESILGEDFVSFSLLYDNSIITDNPIAIVNTIAKQDRIDVVVFEISYEDGHRWETYYKTNIDDEFLRINTSKGTSLLDRDECFTNTDLLVQGISVYRLNIPTTDSIIIYPFEYLEKTGCDISTCILYCKTASSKTLFQSLTDKGFVISNYSYSTYTSDSNSIIILIPAAMFLVAVLFYTLSECKKIVLLKMDGYSCFDIIGQEICANLRFDLILTLVLCVLTAVIVRFFVGYSMLTYIKETKNIFLTAVYVIVFSIVIRLIITAFTNKHAHIKGAVPKRTLYSVTNIVKALSLLALMIMSITTIIMNLLPAINSYKSSLKFADKIKNRASFSQYGNYEQSLLDDQNVNLLPFYKEVCEERDALYIDASDYSVIGGIQTWELSGEDKPRIDVNENYLDYSIFFDPHGKKITSNDINPQAFNVLLPDQITDQDRTIVEMYREAFHYEEANIMIYDSGNYEMYSFITDGVDSDLGMITTPPMIFVYDYHFFELCPEEISQILYGKLFIKTSTDKPEVELRPLIKKYNLENTIDRVSSTDENIQEYLKDASDYLISCIISALLVAVVIIGISVFSADIYCRNNSKKISVELIEGKSPNASVKKHLIIQLIIYALVFVMTLVISAVLHTNMIITGIIVLAVMTVDYLIIYARCLKQSYKNLYGIIKGEK